MVITIRQTLPQDAEELARIWLASLESNPMVRLASPEGITPKRLAGATRKTLEDLDDPVALCLTACDDETGAIMGCAVWRYYPNGKGLPNHASNDEEMASDNTSRVSPPVSAGQTGCARIPNISEDLDSASNAIFDRHVGTRPHAGK